MLRDVGWASNALGTPEVVGEAGDLRATISPGLKLVFPFRQAHLISVDGEVGYRWYRDLEALRGFNTAVAARYDYSAVRWSLSLSNRFINADRNQYELIEIGDDVVPPQLEIFGRVREATNYTALSLSWSIVSRGFLEGRASRNIVRFEDREEGIDTGVSKALDRTEDSIGGSIGYRVLPKTRVSLEVDWQLDDYETPGNFRTAETYRARARVQLDATAPVSGQFALGFRDQAPREATVVGFSGLVLDGNLAVHPGGTTEIHFFGARDIFPTFWSDSIYALRQGGGLSTLVQLNRALGVGADASIYEHSYPTEATVEQSDGSTLTARRYDRINSFAARVRWQVTRVNVFDLRIGYYYRTSNFDILNNRGLFVGSGYTFTY
jgi:hypothetical protein